MKVELIAYTKDAEKIIAAAAKLCYAKSDVDTLLENLTPEKTVKFIDMLSDLGHESPVEHASYTFAIEGVSRALLAQITRHRIASFSVQSQRYVEKTNFEYITPPEIAASPEASAEFEKAMAEAAEHYDNIRKILAAEHERAMLAEGKSPEQAKRDAGKKANEDARFVLPNACDTRMIVTMNVRSLYHFFNIRCCNRAQWEIRQLAKKMLIEVRRVSPALFKNAGPSCLCGPCAEGAYSCGKIKEVREEYRSPDLENGEKG